jgi:reactive intermediate/imine deaminase
MAKTPIYTPDAPAPIGPYSQAVRCGGLVHLSGQIGLDPASGQLVEGIAAQTERVFDNLAAVAAAAGASLEDAVRITVYLTDLTHFGIVNEAMSRRFTQPYPARVTVGVSSLPRNALVEIDAILHLPAAA